MLVRNCAGGVVFCGDKVLLVRNSDGEWILPKGIVQNGDLSYEVVLRKLREEAGICAEVVSTAGRTNYEISSVSRVKPVCNKITWYILKALNQNLKKNSDTKADEAHFYNLEEAMKLVSSNQDRALLSLSFKEFDKLA